MDDLFKTRIINNENKEQDELKIENFKPLSDLIKTDLLLQPSTMNNKKVTLKKSSSYSSFNNNQEVNLEQTKKSFHDFDVYQKTNSLNTSKLFNNNINFTTLNESAKINLFAKKNNINGKDNDNNNNKSSITQLYSKNFAHLMKMNDFSFDIGKYDKKIILNLNNKVKEIENKLILSLKYYYQMENLLLDQSKKKSDLENKLNIINKEMNDLRGEYEKSRQKNVELNNALLNSKNEINRLIQEIKEDQKLKMKKQQEYNDILKKEEIENEKLKSEIKINERQINILEEKINYSNLSHTAKVQKYKDMMKMEKTTENYQNLMKKNAEILLLKNTIKELQLEVDNLQKDLKKGKKDKDKLMSEIKLKDRKKKFNNDNISLLYKTIDQQNDDENFKYNILKSNNLIIKDLYEKINGNAKKPHYSLPKNIRINSAQKSKNNENIIDL